MREKGSRMKKQSKKRPPQKRQFKITVRNPTIKSVELAIQKKLAAQRTDVFRNFKEVRITIVEEGHHREKMEETE
jgi:hypothetical protein